MTNYVEQMMETAGVNLIAKYPNLNFTEVSNDFSRSQYAEEGYPEFTAEKQLELIKLIATIQGFAGMGEMLDWYAEFDGLSLEEGIAKSITYQITSGKLDKEKVKEILQC